MSCGIPWRQLCLEIDVKHCIISNSYNRLCHGGFNINWKFRIIDRLSTNAMLGLNLVHYEGFHIWNWNIIHSACYRLFQILMGSIAHWGSVAFLAFLFFFPWLPMGQCKLFSALLKNIREKKSRALFCIWSLYPFSCATAIPFVMQITILLDKWCHWQNN